MVQLSGILNQYFRSSLSGPDHSIAGPFDSQTQKVSEKLTIPKPDIQLSDAYCTCIVISTFVMVTKMFLSCYLINHVTL